MLYGLIPLTSQELSESEQVDAAFDIGFVKDHLSDFLRATSSLIIDRQESDDFEIKNLGIGSFGINNLSQNLFINIPISTPIVIPEADRSITGRSAANLSQQEEKEAFRDYLDMLRQLSVEFEFAKADNGGRLSARSQSLLNSLNKFNLIYGDRQEPAGDALIFAARHLLDSEGTTAVTMPSQWGVISDALGDEIAGKVKAILDSRLGLSTPQLRRFDQNEGNYHIRAFVRVTAEDDCPPTLYWSLPSPEFTIRPWYDNSPVQPVQVALPDILGKDRSILENLKPNVAFSVPAGLFDEIEGMTLQDLLDGKKPSKNGLGIGWICGFNIPIITICAFIVLNIFLSLLNFIFWWLPFIKICVPIPQRSQGDS